MYKSDMFWYNIYMIDTDRKEGTDMGLLELDNVYHKVWKEYCDAPSGSLKEIKLGKKLAELDYKINEAAAKVEFDWGSD